MGGEDKLEQLWIAYSLKKFAHGSGGGGTNTEAAGDTSPGLCDCSLGLGGQRLHCAWDLHVYM